jgi:hypothetical protein
MHRKERSTTINRAEQPPSKPPRGPRISDAEPRLREQNPTRETRFTASRISRAASEKNLLRFALNPCFFSPSFTHP